MTRKDLLTLHEETCSACRDVMARKNADYAGTSEEDGDPFSNFRAARVVGVEPAKGILVRSLDKFKRIQSFIDRGDLKVKSEPVDDAIDDVINYMILLKALLRDDPRH